MHLNTIKLKPKLSAFQHVSIQKILLLDKLYRKVTFAFLHLKQMHVFRLTLRLEIYLFVRTMYTDSLRYHTVHCNTVAIRQLGRKQCAWTDTRSKHVRRQTLALGANLLPTLVVFSPHNTSLHNN